MCGVPPMWLVILLIDASAVNERLEVVFICSFVGGQVALGALEVPGRLVEGVFISCLWVLLLCLQQSFDGSGSGELLSDWFVRSEIWFRSLVCQECTVLLEMVFNDLDGEGLMHPCVAGLALVPTSVWDPLVLVGLPGCFALVDEALFVLFGCMTSSANRFVMDEVLGIFEDLFKSGCRMFVDLQVIEVKSFLPVLRLSIVEGGCPLIGSQRCIALSPAEMWFIGWRVW